MNVNTREISLAAGGFLVRREDQRSVRSAYYWLGRAYSECGNAKLVVGVGPGSRHTNLRHVSSDQHIPVYHASAHRSPMRTEPRTPN